MLAKAAAEPAEGGKVPLARVISVLGAGHEGAVNLEDLDLKKTYSLANAATHAQSFNTLAPLHLWSKDPEAYKGITFIHSAPGGVQTSLAKRPGIAKYALKALFPIVRTLLPSQINTPVECGERHVWAGTADAFGNGGVVLLGPKSEEIKSEAVEKMVQEGIGEKIWEHTLEVFKSIDETGKF